MCAVAVVLNYRHGREEEEREDVTKWEKIWRSFYGCRESRSFLSCSRTASAQSTWQRIQGWWQRNWSFFFFQNWLALVVLLFWWWWWWWWWCCCWRCFTRYNSRSNFKHPLILFSCPVTHAHTGGSEDKDNKIDFSRNSLNFANRSELFLLFLIESDCDINEPLILLVLFLFEGLGVREVRGMERARGWKSFSMRVDEWSLNSIERRSCTWTNYNRALINLCKCTSLDGLLLSFLDFLKLISIVDLEYDVCVCVCVFDFVCQSLGQ